MNVPTQNKKETSVTIEELLLNLQDEEGNVRSAILDSDARAYALITKYKNYLRTLDALCKKIDKENKQLKKEIEQLKKEKI